MTYSFTQISQYLRCPRSYRYRYLEGWREKENPLLLFGRCFEKALAAFFLGQDSPEALFKEWGAHRETPLVYKPGEEWERLYRQGVQLLERLAQDDRVRISQPRLNMQVKLTKALPGGNEFVAYVDALGMLDGQYSLLEWKTTTSRYPEEPAGLIALDPQLICYSWMSGISDVAVVAFVRKRFCEIQYLKTTITEEQRLEFGTLVDATIGQIEAGYFPQRNGIRFPQNGCISCAQLGHCLRNDQLVAAKLVRQPGASDLDWLNDLDD